MPAIRIPKENWGKVWHALLDIGEIHRIPPEDEKVYIVSDKHIEHLKARNLPYLDEKTADEPAILDIGIKE